MNNDYQIKGRCSLYTSLFLIGMDIYFSSSLRAYVSILPSTLLSCLINIDEGIKLRVIGWRNNNVIRICLIRCSVKKIYVAIKCLRNETDCGIRGFTLSIFIAPYTIGEILRRRAASALFIFSVFLSWINLSGWNFIGKLLLKIDIQVLECNHKRL